jgi:dTDP-4-amino-4,6-dideoxygalactose transaminase
MICGGEGGALLTSSREIYERALLLGHNQQRIASEATAESVKRFSPLGYGLKLRIHPLAAVLAIQHLERLDRLVEQQRTTAAILRDTLANSWLSPPQERQEADRVFYNYKTLVVPEELKGEARRPIVETLRKFGIPARVPDSGLLADYACFRESCVSTLSKTPRSLQGAFPGAREFFRSSITVPFPWGLSLSETRRLGETLRLAPSLDDPMERLANRESDR